MVPAAAKVGDSLSVENLGQSGQRVTLIDDDVSHAHLNSKRCDGCGMTDSCACGGG